MSVLTVQKNRLLLRTLLIHWRASPLYSMDHVYVRRDRGKNSICEAMRTSTLAGQNKKCKTRHYVGTYHRKTCVRSQLNRHDMKIHRIIFIYVFNTVLMHVLGTGSSEYREL